VRWQLLPLFSADKEEETVRLGNSIIGARDEDDYGLPAVIKALKDSILTELQGSLALTGPPLAHRQSGGPGEI